MNLFDAFTNKKFTKLFNKSTEQQLSKHRNSAETYSEIAQYYLTLISMLNADKFKSFKFPDYEDSRRIKTDNKEYDLDNEFCHSDNDAIEALCAIDSLIADLNEDTTTVLKNTENIINKTVNV